MYPDGLKKLTANTITDFSVLEEELRNVREEGFAREVEESNLGIRCLAKPVVVKGKVPAAVSVGIPVFRYDASKEEAIKRCLSDAVEKISKILAGVQACLPWNPLSRITASNLWAKRNFPGVRSRYRCFPLRKTFPISTNSFPEGMESL